jgi:hypothetical protein
VIASSDGTSYSLSRREEWRDFCAYDLPDLLSSNAKPSLFSRPVRRPRYDAREELFSTVDDLGLTMQANEPVVAAGGGHDFERLMRQGEVVFRAKGPIHPGETGQQFTWVIAARPVLDAAGIRLEFKVTARDLRPQRLAVVFGRNDMAPQTRKSAEPVVD